MLCEQREVVYVYVNVSASQRRVERISCATAGGGKLAVKLAIARRTSLKLQEIVQSPLRVLSQALFLGEACVPQALTSTSGGCLLLRLLERSCMTHSLLTQRYVSLDQPP